VKVKPLGKEVTRAAQAIHYPNGHTADCNKY
jgi:hypothetical protein